MLKHLHSSPYDEDGQAAIGMVLSLFFVMLFFALAFDAGAWYFDRRQAQNQTEAAALAAAQELPASSTTDALNRGNDWLVRNGEASCSTCFTFTDFDGDGKYDTVRAKIVRNAPGFFASLAGINTVQISAAATARAGRVNIANVMPWAIIPPDPDCGPTAGRNCLGDFNGDGDTNDPGDCNASFTTCPFGLSLDRLYAFKEGGGGNTGIIDSCGGGISNYRDCISGAAASGFYEVGSTVNVGLQGGNAGQNTASALEDRYPNTTPSWSQCDVISTPVNSSGHDPDGRASGKTKWIDSPISGCERRLVIVPILRSLPPQGGGSTSNQVLAIATFGIAKWNRSNNRDSWGTAAQECTPQQGGQPPPNQFNCGMVWGYLYQDVRPPEFLLEQFGGNNPLAPILIALID